MANLNSKAESQSIPKIICTQLLLPVPGVDLNGLQGRQAQRYPRHPKFATGTPAAAKLLSTCLPCHEALKDRDLVFTRYSP